MKYEWPISLLKRAQHYSCEGNAVKWDHLTPWEQLKLKGQTIPSVGRATGILTHWQWRCKMVQPLCKNCLVVYYKIKHTFTLWLSNSIKFQKFMQEKKVNIEKLDVFP